MVGSNPAVGVRRRAVVALVLAVLAGLVVAAVGNAEPAWAGAFTTTGVSGTFQLNDITCVSSSTCVAVGSSSSQGAAAVEIVNGVPGTVATSTDANSGRLDKVVCVSATSCLASGVGNNSFGEIIAITLGAQATLGTPHYVTDTFELFGLACRSATACVAVGGNGFSSSAGSVVDIDNGVVQPTQFVQGVNQFLAVACPSSTTCVAAGSYSHVSVDVISGGVPGPIIQLSAVLNVYDEACSSTSCVVVGYSYDTSGHGAYVTVSPTGTAGTVQNVAGTSSFTGVQCPSATCVAVGSSDTNLGAIDAFTPGSVAGTPEDDPDAASLSGVFCTAALSCLASGDSNTANEGLVASDSLTAPTATISGTVRLTKNGNTAAVTGSPLQACATDRSFCTSGVPSAVGGSYSFIVPSGETYVVTAYSPVGQSDTAGVSAPVDTAASGQTYSNVNVTMTPGPGLGSGVSVSGFGAQQDSSTAVPTVNWSIPFAVTLAPSVFQTPAGDSSTLLTLVLTGTSTQTGTVESKTVYAGGEITVNGQPSAVGLPVDPTTGVTVQVPPLAPIHGAVGMAITYSSSPKPATGVTAAPDPLVLTNGNPTASVAVAATDFAVDHTVGVPTLSGTDRSSFSIGSPNCAGTNLVQNSAGTSPHQSCAIPVTWHAPSSPSKNTYQAMITIPVTNSSGQAGVLQDQLFACDTRIQGNSQCYQGPPPARRRRQQSAARPDSPSVASTSIRPARW